MADDAAVGLRMRHRRADHVVAVLDGELTRSGATTAQRSLTTLLIDHSRVLLDISAARLTWAPAPELFVTAVDAAGGWPSARLALIGADRATVERLRACRVTESVPLVATEREAAAAFTRRPARALRSMQFPAHPSSAARARAFAADSCRQWELPVAPAVEVVDALVGDAVQLAPTGFRLRLVLEPERLRISVRDDRPGSDPAPPDRFGRIDALGVPWGVLHSDDGTAVWALLETGRAAQVRTLAGPSGVAGPDGEAPPAVVRRHLVTHDVELAHEFLSSAYCGHSPRLTGPREQFQLEFSATATDFVAVERVSHSMAVHAEFEPCPALFVVRHVGGRFEIGTRRASHRTAPGDVVLVGPGLEHKVGWDQLDVEAVRLDPAAVAAVAADVCDVDPAAVRFDLARPVSRQRARHWRSLVQVLRHGVLDNEKVLSSPLVRAATFRHLVATLVETFPNPALDVLLGSAPDRAGWSEPAVVRRAVLFIEEHAADDIGLGDIARAARVGPRALQLAFRRHRDATPLEHLRRVRLDHAHGELLAADPTVGDTVSDVAARWGFAHLGHFAASYRRAYGHSPGVTLRS